MSRWKAAAIHLCASVIIAALASWVLLGVWYPPPYFQAAGAGHLLALIVGVDVAIGPLITLLVFKVGKRGLKFDLAVIAILQAAALGYGIHTIVLSRPVFLATAVDRFVLVAADDIDPNDLSQAPRAEWRHLSWTGPVLVGTQLPTKPKAHNKLLFESFRTGKDVQDFPRYYVPYRQAVPQLLKRAKPIHALIAMHPDKRRQIVTWLKDHDVTEQRTVWLPIQTRDGGLTMIVKAHSGKPVGAMAVNPWPE